MNYTKLALAVAAGVLLAAAVIGAVLWFSQPTPKLMPTEDDRETEEAAATKRIERETKITWGD